MMMKSKGNQQYFVFGMMALILGLGDSFHLVPRAFALCTTGLENYSVVLGIGKFITSVTMTIFYLLLYFVWRLRYSIKNRQGYTVLMLGLVFLRIVLCFMPQNAWTSTQAPLSWGIYRNLPFVAMGFLVIFLFNRSGKETGDRAFHYMGLTIALSFAFYLPVVLLDDFIPMIGMLMIPKTCAYVWTVVIGYWDMKKNI